MIKLLDLIKEIEYIKDTNIWYHGSTANINQNDLDPLFRQNKGKEFMSAKAAGEGNTGSQNGTGIYFGKDKTCMSSFCPMNYTGFYTTYAKEGFMYEMKLKPEAKVIRKSDLHNVSEEAFNRLTKQEGVDALTNDDELNLLNPDVIQYFKKIMHWKKVLTLWPDIRGKIQKDKATSFNNEKEMSDFLQKELGDYKPIPAENPKYYVPKDENIDKAFAVGISQKWFNV
jgi:hypothetical protein